jgi:hypothetical protein
VVVLDLYVYYYYYMTVLCDSVTTCDILARAHCRSVQVSSGS